MGLGAAVLAACGGDPGPGLEDEGFDAPGSGGGPITGGGGGGTHTGGRSGGSATGGRPPIFGPSGGGTQGGSDGSATGGSGPGAGGLPGSGAAPSEELPKFVGNITTGNQVDAANLTFSDYWDQITPENAGKWGSVQLSVGGAYNWTTLDAIYDYAEDHGIVFKQHAFIWGSQQPGGSPNEAQVKDWMQSFCDRYPNTRLIDVVNEPPPHTTPNYVNNIGGGTNGNWKWIENAFRWARDACPNAILLLNDYNNIEWAAETQHIIDIVNIIKDAGAPIDAIGAQSHDLDVVSTDKMKGLIQQLHQDTGLPIYITEYDISTSDDNRQLQLYREQIPYFLEQEWIHGITIWGWIRGRTWSQAPESGIVSQQGQPRPAMTWLMETLGRPVP